MANYKITIENIRGDEIRDKPYGEGTEDNPYKISSAENLVYVAEHPEMWNGKYFLQTNNIDMSGIDWVIGISLNRCSYNGSNYSISNLDILQINNKGFGLFWYLYNTVISNLSINYSTFTGVDGYSSIYFGLICSSLMASSEIINCIVDNCSINANGRSIGCGAIAGANIGSTISYCISSSNIINSNYGVGGIAGFSQDGETSFCVSKNNQISNVDSSNSGSVGGIVGWNHYYSIIANCYSFNNSINASSSLSLNTIFCGGISGWTDDSSFEVQDWSNSNITNTTTATNVYIGGVNGVNHNPSSLSNTSYWDYEASGIGDSDYTNPSGIKANKITTAQLAQQSTFTDWDFTDVWEMGTSYPVLQFESFVIEKETEVFEYSFPYKILKNTTKYDPFSYISYDYMISTSRTAKFDAFIDDYFDDETFDFINNLTRVGYKKKIDENNGKYDNDITLYNHFYYSTEDDEDEFVRIELDDNTIEHKIGKEIEDKYGKLRTVSSREIITEGVSTLMCRIYELTTDNERLVYSGLIDKRETKFDGTKLSVSLIDMMGLYVELSEKYNKVVSDFNDSGFDAISLVSSIREFILFIKNNININTKYLPSAGGISANNEYIGEIIKTYFHEYTYDDENNSLPLKYAFSSLNDSLLYGYIKVETVISDDGAISLSIPDINDINSNDDLNLNIENMGSESILMFNPSSANMLNITKSYNFDLNFSDKLFPTERKKYPVIFNLKYEYRKKVVDNIAKIRLIPNIAILYNNIVDDEVVNDIFTLTTSKNYEVEYDTDLDFFEYASDNGTSNMYLFIKDTLSDYIENISENIISFENEINSLFNNEAMFLTLSEESNYIFNNEAIASYISIFDDPSENDYNYLIKVESQKRFIGDITIDDNYDMFKMEDVYFTNTYTSTIPLYADTYSLYDITKLFSLTCYNKILTKNTGELYFDKESYSENNGYIYIDKSDIINNFSQQSMIGDDEEFEVLDNVYVGTKYIKEAYKRLETSTKENYKKLYENNNMKVSFNLRNYVYDIKSNLTTTIDQREIEPKDVIRIMHNGYEKIRVFVTSVKFINNNTEIEIEGITLQTRNITVSHLKSDSK